MDVNIDIDNDTAFLLDERLKVNLGDIQRQRRAGVTSLLGLVFLSFKLLSVLDSLATDFRELPIRRVLLWSFAT